MIVKGIIKTIDFKGNTCTVRIPVFESAANNSEVVVPAVLSTIPGLYNGYKVGDVVFIGFENDQLNSPVVISKLYLGADKEGKTPRGAVNIESFKASEPISIPVDTKLTLKNDPNKLSTVKVKNSISDYKTIADVIKGLQVQKEQIGSLDVQIVDNGKELGAKVNKTQDAQTTGFGWNLTDTSWILQAYNSEHGFKYTDIFKATQEGVEVTGTIKVKDFPRYTRTTYAITDDDVKPTIEPWDKTYNRPENPPRAPWSLIEPEQTIGKRLWVATTVWVYTLNETQELEEDVKTTIQDGALLRYTYYYKQVQHDDPAPEKPADNTIPTEASGWTALVPEKDSTKDTYRCTQILEDDDDPHGTRHITYTDLILINDTALVVEQGKSTTYYSDRDPGELGYNVKYGDCWFDTNITLGNLLHIEDYVGTYIILPGATTYTLVTEENINTPTIYNFLNNWLPQTVVQVKYIIDESTGERIEPAAFHPEDYFVKLTYAFVDLIRTPIMYKEDIKTYGRSSIDSEDRFVYIGYIVDPELGILNKWRKQNTVNNEFVDTDFVVYTNNIARRVSPGSSEIRFYITQEQLDNDIRVDAVAYSNDSPTANYLKQWVGDHWEDVGGEIIANKVTAEYINAKDIVAKKITVMNGNEVVLNADAKHPEDTQLGGLKVDTNKLAFNEQDENNRFKLATGNSGYICYRSTNCHVIEHTSTSIIKIRTLEAIDTLTIYIRSNGNPNEDYCMATTTDTYWNYLPTTAEDPQVFAHTKGNPQATNALDNYTAVTYTNLPADAWFYILYQKNSFATTYEDYGYLLIGAADLQKLEITPQEDVDEYRVPFERYEAFDIDYEHTELLIGKDFSVDAVGTLSATNASLAGKVSTQNLSVNGIKLNTSKVLNNSSNFEQYELTWGWHSAGTPTQYYYIDYTITCRDYNGVVRPVAITKPIKLTINLCENGSWGVNYHSRTEDLSFPAGTFVLKGSVQIGTEGSTYRWDDTLVSITPTNNSRYPINFKNNIGCFTDLKNCAFREIELFPSVDPVKFTARDYDANTGHANILEVDVGEALRNCGLKKVYWFNCEVVFKKFSGAPSLTDLINRTYYSTYDIYSDFYIQDPNTNTNAIYIPGTEQTSVYFSWLIGQQSTADYGFDVEVAGFYYDPAKARIDYIKIAAYGELDTD